MTKEKSTTSRLVAPRTWAVIAATGLAGAPLGLATATGFATPAQAEQPAVASEAGEAGEAGVERSDGPAQYLTELGLFEAAHRIVAALYASGDVALAQEHLEGSHHAYYEDIAAHIAAHNGTGFELATLAFATAVAAGADAKTVADAAQTVLAAIATAGDAAQISPREQVISMKELIAIAEADFGAGVEDGQVTFGQEYRDAWGFVETVRARAALMATSDDPAMAKAGRGVLAQLETVAPLFPALTATQAPGDPGLLAGAAAWIEIIALRLD